MDKLPARLYVCPSCDYYTEWRWVLANHLKNVHGLTKKDAKILAENNEYLANPIYQRRELESDD